jgi:hypothetical protein
MLYTVLLDKELERYNKLQKLKKKLEKYNSFHSKENQLTGSNHGHPSGTKHCSVRTKS